MPQSGMCAAGGAIAIPAAGAAGAGIEAGALAPFLAMGAAIGGILSLSGDTPQQQFVVRGGMATPGNLIQGSGPVRGYGGLTGFSVTTARGMSVDQLAFAGRYPNGQISYSTTAALSAAGAPVVATPQPGMPLHGTVSVPVPLDPVTAAKISAAFKQKPNPAKCP